MGVNAYQPIGNTSYRTHNDASPSGRFAHGLGEVDLYLWDSYPQGFDCANPASWPEVNSVNLDTAHQVLKSCNIWQAARAHHSGPRPLFLMSCGVQGSSSPVPLIRGVAYVLEALLF